MKIVATIALLASSAAVAEPTRYVQGDAMIGFAQPVAGLNAMAGIEGGGHLEGPMWLHGTLAYGPAGDDQGPGTNTLASGGLEVRGCVAASLCAIAGGDVGVQHGTWSSNRDGSTETANAVIAIPRAAIDVGGAKLRVRVGLQLDVALAATDRYRDGATDLMVTRGGLAGAELATGVAYRW